MFNSLYFPGLEYILWGALIALFASGFVLDSARGRYGLKATFAGVIAGNIGTLFVFVLVDAARLRWDWWSPDMLGCALLFTPCGILASVLSLELYLLCTKR